MHVDSGFRPNGGDADEASSYTAARTLGDSELDKEVRAIFERTYGKVDPQRYLPRNKPAEKPDTGPDF